jgi:hypothetical protein
MNVCIVAAAKGGRSLPAAWISAAMSASEYRYGVARVLPAGNRSGGGTSVAGSKACRQRAKLRTTLSRCACQVVERPGRVAHRTASCVLMVSAPAVSAKSTNCSSSWPAPASWYPRARRTAR